MTKEQARDLVKRIQDGIASMADERRLVEELKSRYKPHKHENHIYNQEELEAEYLFASWNAVFRAKLNIGDPIAFCTNRGRGAMLDYYRKISSERLLLVCKTCGTEYTYDRRNKHCKNQSCEAYGLEDSLKSEEKINYREMADFDNDFRYHDRFVEQIEIADIMVELVEVIGAIEEIKYSDKTIAIGSLQNQSDFYDYARSTGKSHSWSIAFKKRIQQALAPFKDRFLIAV